MRRLGWLGIGMAAFGAVAGVLGWADPALHASIDVICLLFIAALFMGLLVAPRVQQWKSRDSGTSR